MEVKPGYKQTEVGVIPEDWSISPLSSLTSLLTNGFVGTATNAYVSSDDGVLYIQGYNVEENGFNFYGIKRVSRSFHAQHQKSSLQPGDLLTIQTGDIGVTAVVPQELAGSNCHALLISRLNKRISEPAFYSQYFNSERGRVALKEIETGTTMKHLNGGDMKRLLMPCPPVDEQRAIATALSDMDALLDGLARLIAKKRAIKQATMQQLLTGQTRLPGFSGEWEARRLGDFGTCLRGVGYNPDTDLFSGDSRESVRLLRANNIQQSTIVLDGLQFVSSLRVSEQKFLRKNDVLICMANGSKELVGKAANFDISDGQRYTFGAFMGCYRPNAVVACPKFSFFLFQTDAYRGQISVLLAGSSINNLSPSGIEGLVARAPTQREEQTAIATVLGDMDTEITALEIRRTKTCALKQAMMQELLTGRTRLV